MGNVVIYTDGACEPNPGFGGWGVVFCGANNSTKEFCGGEKNTTNNRMEMMAAIAALEMLKRPCCVTLYTDSRYLIDGATRWMRGWLKNDFKHGTIKNIDLWKRIELLQRTHNIDWCWVKGHSGNEGNERADELARLGRKHTMRTI
jgi:ribonuclease HI